MEKQFLMRNLFLTPLFAFSLSIVFASNINGHDDGHGAEKIGVKIETLAKSSFEWDGDLLPKYPKSQPEITVLQITIPPGTILPLHTHPVINAAVILEGTLEVILPNGTKRTFNEGEALIEVVNTAHYGKTVGNESVVVLVVYAGTKDSPTTVLLENQ